MVNRRAFIQWAALASTFFVTKPSSATTLPKQRRVVISTWDFGIRANEEAWKILSGNGSALDAIENGARKIEADPLERSVGFGGLPDRDGRVTLDASIMDHEGNCGSVAFLEHIKHPISVARLVMEKTPHVMLAGEGALKFAMENGFERTNLLTPQSEKTWKEWLKTADYKPVINIENHDTIGILAMDASGHLAGGCTTSGLAFKMNGRVGDSPIIGAGLYVDSEVGAATATGLGEEIVKIVGSYLVVELMRQGKSPKDACRIAVERAAKKNPAKAKEIQIGFIALNKDGQHGAYSLHPGFTYAVRDDQGNSLQKAESYFK